VWKTVTLSVFGVVVNSIHAELFSHFHLKGELVNFLISSVYLVSTLAMSYWFKNDRLILLSHIVFAFFPLRRVWQVNVYGFVILVTMCMIIMFSKCRTRSLLNSSLHIKPVLKFFAYLRIHDYLVLIGILQLFLELHVIYAPERDAVKKIKQMIEEERLKNNENIDTV
jgi:hypothetical protein